jgi:hypothetical protein
VTAAPPPADGIHGPKGPAGGYRYQLCAANLLEPSLEEAWQHFIKNPAGKDIATCDTEPEAQALTGLLNQGLQLKRTAQAVLSGASQDGCTPDLCVVLQADLEALQAATEMTGRVEDADEATSRIVLTLSNPRDGGPWAMTVRHKRTITDPREAVKAAALEFLQTPEGQAIADSNHGDFNYGDAATEIPDEILARHGITQLDMSSKCWTDGHDNNFAAED